MLFYFLPGIGKLNFYLRLPLQFPIQKPEGFGISLLRFTKASREGKITYKQKHSLILHKQQGGVIKEKQKDLVMEIGGISHTEEILLAQEAKLREQNNKNTIPHPADLVDQEACQSVSIGVPTLKAVNSKKPYF